MVSHWSLSDSKSPVVWMVFTHPLISKSSSLCINPLVTVPRAPITIDVTVLQFFFNSLAGSRHLFLFRFLSILLYVQPAQQSPQFSKFSSFLLLLTVMRCGRLAEIRGSVCISKFQRSLRVSSSWTDSGLCIYYLFVWSNLNFLHNSLWINLPIKSCLVLYSFYASLLHSLMWLIVSSLSPHNRH